MLLSLSLCLLQNPQLPELPQHPPTPALPEWQTQLDELVDQVRDGFQDVHQALLSARDQLDVEQSDSILLPQLSLAQDTAHRLVASLEELLENIPTQESNSSSANGADNKQGDSGDSKPEDTQNHENPSGAAQKPQNNSGKEDERGKSSSLSPEQRILFEQQNGHWGSLPPRLQEALQNAAVENMPLRYRRWLKEFHRQQLGPNL